MRASLSVLYFGLLLPVSVLGNPITSPSDSNVARREPLAVGHVVGALSARSADAAEPVAQLKARDHDDDDGIIDDIKNGIDDVGDDIHDSVHDALDDGVGSVKPGMITVGLLATAVALGLM
jgi:hypothetical protein